jgi:uncharacterized protein (DUF433 family)
MVQQTGNGRHLAPVRVDRVTAITDSSRMTVPGHPRIAIDPAVCGGRPVVAGTRMRVQAVLEMMAGGATEAEIAEDFPYVSREDVRAVLAYAAAMANHPVVLAAE